MAYSVSGIFLSASGAIVLCGRSQCEHYLSFLSFISFQPLWFDKFGGISVGFAELLKLDKVVARFGRRSVRLMKSWWKMKGLLLCLTLFLTPLTGKSFWNVKIRRLNIREKVNPLVSRWKMTEMCIDHLSTLTLKKHIHFQYQFSSVGI